MKKITIPNLSNNQIEYLKGDLCVANCEEKTDENEWIDNANRNKKTFIKRANRIVATLLSGYEEQ